MSFSSGDSVRIREDNPIPGLLGAVSGRVGVVNKLALGWRFVSDDGDVRFLLYDHELEDVLEHE